ncbi:MAG: phosphatidate cytidylyltransferase [Desulfomonilaceae bacterium]
MLTTRIISALIAIILIVPTLFWGGVLGVTLLVIFFASIGAWELTNNLPNLRNLPSRLMAVGLGILIILMFYWISVGYVPAVITLFPLVAMLLHLFCFRVIQNTIDSVTQVIFVGSYLVIPLAHAILLSRIDDSNVWLFFVLVIVCLGDAGAFFAGKYYGKTHFSANVSPKKTIEGLGGGLLGALAGMIIMKIIAPAMPPLGLLLKATVLLWIVGALGDLCASAIKRRIGIKDFGSIMPGHGGIMDRADSLIPSIPVLYYFLVVSGYGISS